MIKNRSVVFFHPVYMVHGRKLIKLHIMFQNNLKGNNFSYYLVKQNVYLINKYNLKVI